MMADGKQGRLVAPPSPTTAAVTAAAAATPAAAASTPAAATATLLGPRFVHRERATIDHLAVHAINGRLGFLIRSHLDETESLGSSGVAVRDDLGRCHHPIRGK